MSIFFGHRLADRDSTISASLAENRARFIGSMHPSNGGVIVFEQHYLDESIVQLGKLKTLAEKAIAQIDDASFVAVLDPEANSVALVMKHIAGNMRSRWTDFLTTDGEKPTRERDEEFTLDPTDTRASIVSAWEDGWKRTLNTISSLKPDDLGRTVTIRGEPHTVVEAINRQLAHYAAHVGQIVLLAKHYAGASWRSLSIPRGKSRDYDVSKAGSTYRLEDERK